MSKKEIELKDGNEFYKGDKLIATYELVDGEVDFTFTAPVYGKHKEDMLDLIDGIAVPVEDIKKEEVTIDKVINRPNLMPKDLEGCPEHSIRLGDRTPEVIDFARSNMSEEQFNAHYKGRVNYEA